jgi:hypothetical protein
MMKRRIRIIAYRNIHGSRCYNYYQDDQYIGFYGATNSQYGLWNANEKDYEYHKATRF